MLGLRAEWHGAISEQQTFAFGLVGQMIVHSLWACRAPYRIHEDLVPHRADAQPVRYHALGDLPLRRSAPRNTYSDKQPYADGWSSQREPANCRRAASARPRPTR